MEPVCRVREGGVDIQSAVRENLGMQVTIDITPESYTAYENQAQAERTTLNALIGRVVDRFSPRKPVGAEYVAIHPQTELPVIYGLPTITSEDVRALEEEDDLR